MKLIKSSVTNITPRRYFEEDILKHIELCGRTCYKSEDKITDTSAEKFVNMLKKNKHRSVLEHGTVYLWTRDTSYTLLDIWKSELFDKYDKNPYSVAYMDGPDVYITTNYRVIIENGWESDLKFIVDYPSELHEPRYTFRITCSRAIANEVVRHRQLSFSQESSRYCDYSKDKFGKELTFIIPKKLNNILIEGRCYFDNGVTFSICPFNGSVWNTQFINYPEQQELIDWLNTLYISSNTYFRLLNLYKWKPEEARGILPLDLKTDIIVTGTKSQWEAFCDLRCAKSAHPDIQVIANEIKKQIWNE